MIRDEKAECEEQTALTVPEKQATANYVPAAAVIRRWQAWGANRIRYPGSPRRKRWILGVGGIDPFRAAVNTISIPPGEYGRKVETQRN